MEKGKEDAADSAPMSLLLRTHLPRLLRRAGVFAKSPDVFTMCRDISLLYLHDLLQNVSQHLHKSAPVALFVAVNNVTVDDVLALRPDGILMLGFGGPSGIRFIWSDAICKVLRQVHPDFCLNPLALSCVNDACAVFH